MASVLDEFEPIPDDNREPVASIAAETSPDFLPDLLEYEFLLKDVFGVFDEDTWPPLAAGLRRVRDFCDKQFVEAGAEADRESCRLTASGEVITPSSFPAIQARFRETFPDQGSRPVPEDHPVVRYSALEMLMGANASFMTYFGFNRASIDMLKRYGGFPEAEDMIERLRCMDWSSCFCVTEDEAGSDVSLITTKVVGRADDHHLIRGRKRLISAGMHDLAENIVYFVLAQSNPEAGNAGMSCFVVPRFWTGADGRLQDNNVRCVDLAEKMGFKGCVNATLEFGEAGPTRGYLMGGREGVGLLQLLTLMVQARISTGVYALGIAGDAYRRSVRYASTRRQGRSFRQTLNWRAPVVAIVEHPDVQRMLLSMKCQVEGARALLALLGIFEAETEQGPGKDVSRRMLSLLTPIIKAHVSDQAWRICETAIQVHGGNGYLSGHRVEQAARDVKILSIWEGTNYIQSQYLIRDVLGMGLRSAARVDLVALIESTFEELLAEPAVAQFASKLATRLERWQACLDRIAGWTRAGRLDEVPRVATRFLEITAQLVTGWLLLRVAARAAAALRTSGGKRDDFLRGKLASAEYYHANVLPTFDATVIMICDEESKSIAITPEMF